MIVSRMKYSKLYFCGIVLVLLVAFGCAGNRKAALNHGQSSYSNSGPSSRSSGDDSRSAASSGVEQRKAMKKKGRKAAAAKTHDDLVKEQQDRMEANAKRYKKEAKMAEKPQYSDPSYFGHKKKPKKRPVGKRKFCKECGIVH